MKHMEAYCLMSYASKDGTVRETLWNSRDGVTPFVIPSKDGKTELSHVDWQFDRRGPAHEPKEGDRIFVGTTWFKALEYAKQRMESVKAAGYPVPDDITDEQMIQKLAKNEFYRDGESPDIITVDADLAEAHRATSKRRPNTGQGQRFA